MNEPARFEVYLNDRAALVEAEIDRLLPALDDGPGRLHEAMRYTTLGGGKRLRAVLALEACICVGGTVEQALPLGAALEMIHAFSLIHDDLPCMDDDDMRRGKPSNHIVFGEALAVLAGDALLTLAFDVLSDLPVRAGIGPESALCILADVARATGAAGMIAGQVADLEAERRDATADELTYIHRHKTGALFRASVRAGAMLGGASQDELRALTRFAEHFGVAFQITDDVLDVAGEEARTGKRSGSDERMQKATYPRLYGLSGARRMADEEINGAVESLQSLGERGHRLQQLARFVVDRDR